MGHLRSGTTASLRHRTWSRGAAASAAGIFLLAGCSSGGSSSPGSSSGTSGTSSGAIVIGVVEQQLANPFFLTIEDAAKKAAAAAGATVITAESATAGDSESQVTAIQDMINRGVKGIMVDPANATALVDVIKQARAAGILVVAVNTQTDPLDAVDATFETDNLQAGKLVGQWAKATLGSAAPHVALLDYNLTDRTSKARHDGFLAGFGITATGPEVSGEKETDASVSGGQTAMENILQAHKDVNVVYGINEPMAQGAYAAFQAQGLQAQPIIVGIDGSCSGVAAVKQGQIGATVMQFPTKMADMAIAAIVKYAQDGTKPTSGVTNSGTVLITDKAVSGIDSHDTTWGAQNCWGTAS